MTPEPALLTYSSSRVQFIKPLTTLKSLRTLRLCGISSDSSTSPPAAQHSLKLAEVVLIEVK